MGTITQINLTEANEKLIRKATEEINSTDPDIIQDNADLRELEMRYEKLSMPYEIRRVIDDYIACILSRGERMESLMFCAGMEKVTSE